MYKFSITENTEYFNDFVLNNNGSILQTSMNGKNKEDWKYYCIIGEDKGNKLVITCLFLVKTFLRVFKMGYIPLGFVGDYTNKELLKEMLNYIKKIMKEKHIAFCFTDPNIVLEKEGQLNDNGKIINDLLISYGLKKTTRERPFIQPDTTYIIDLLNEKGEHKTIDELIGEFDKGVRYSIRTSPEKGLKYEAYSYSDIKDKEEIFNEFINVMGQTMNRLGSFTRSKKYFLNFLRNLEPYAFLNMVYYDSNIDREKNNANEERLKLIENDSKSSREINELKSKIEGYYKRVNELQKEGITNVDKLYIAGSITVIYGDTAICLYGGSKNILRNSTRSSHYLNFKRIEDSVNHKCKYHDLSRIYLASKDSNAKNYGLYVFKKSFNAKEVKYIGEYALINNRIYYELFTKALPLFRNMVAVIKRGKKNNEV